MPAETLVLGLVVHDDRSTLFADFSAVIGYPRPREYPIGFSLGWRVFVSSSLADMSSRLAIEASSVRS
jgi:hypothetical protein